ncbi:hypothetical protein PUNSTDRAFT_141926 [Punctularia strigosozonata HHB-11173 SS5]|uniref:uncharacterized protein n=1 Tax=Punctularia strigosozonata (strain HHB-11173) TaxID=741275 RepID=UPI00044178C2|nr:uncharacterized protein PUNSTDRAFT_141926 [Punctularia strigosozonata HHB-11173 SS5]EIN11623.1 hypothetical protein PUNSTDRAFT_141926 [Punctularia strigosozonata HHB-11173 SS5]
MSNPSHILIARNSRGANNPQLSSPIETRAAASGIFRSSAGSPPGRWLLEEMSDSAEGSASSAAPPDESDGEEDSIAVDETFSKFHKFPGTVKIVVESTTFWAHKEVLYFASPFFEAALSGSWSETGDKTKRRSMSSVITIARPRSHSQSGALDPASNTNKGQARSETTYLPTSEAGSEAEETDADLEFINSEQDAQDLGRGEGSSTGLSQRQWEKARQKLEGSNVAEKADDSKNDVSPPIVKLPPGASPAHAKIKRKDSEGLTACIVLKEERASTFHDFLKWIYPNLQCTITWANVEGLLNISHKLCVPELTKECNHFLLTYAAGHPIKAMRIAELFDEADIYCEASRFVLDNPGGWNDAEMGTLSRETLLKLEKRRTWFLERVLKLGLVQMARDYQCCPTCPDPPTCARLVEEKWRQCYHQIFRYGPCQPSMVFRYCRNLEANPPLSLTNLNCQNHAKTFVAALFDRMFSLGMRGVGTDAAPIGTRVASAASGPRRHFLFCNLKAESNPRMKKLRHTS